MIKKILFIFLIFQSFGYSESYVNEFDTKLSAKRASGPSTAWFQPDGVLGCGEKSASSIEVFREISNPNHSVVEYDFSSPSYIAANRNYIAVQKVAYAIWTEIEAERIPELDKIINEVFKKLSSSDVSERKNDVKIYCMDLTFDKKGLDVWKELYLKKSPEQITAQNQEMEQRLTRAASEEILKRNFERTTVGGHGLINHRSSCYINASLQVLHSLTQFREAIININPEDIDAVTYTNGFGDTVHYRKENIKAKKDFIIALQSLFIAMSGEGEEAVSVADFLASLPASIAHHGQDDAPQFIRGFLAELKNALFGTAYISGIENIFDLVTASTLTCSAASHSSTTSAIASDVQLEITQSSSNSIENSLVLLVQPETLDGDNAWYCDSCGKKASATKHTKVLSLPPVLMFQLKRFEAGFGISSGKLSDPVEFQDEIDMAKYLEGPSRTDQFYRLISVIIHSGVIGSGHYWAYVKDTETGKWLEKNDATSSEVTIPDPNKPSEFFNACRGTPYVLVYGRRR